MEIFLAIGNASIWHNARHQPMSVRCRSNLGLCGARAYQMCIVVVRGWDRQIGFIYFGEWAGRAVLVHEPRGTPDSGWCMVGTLGAWCWQQPQGEMPRRQEPWPNARLDAGPASWTLAQHPTSMWSMFRVSCCKGKPSKRFGKFSRRTTLLHCLQWEKEFENLRNGLALAILLVEIIICYSVNLIYIRIRLL